jgi:hypothetical protein
MGSFLIRPSGVFGGAHGVGPTNVARVVIRSIVCPCVLNMRTRHIERCTFAALRQQLGFPLSPREPTFWIIDGHCSASVCPSTRTDLILRCTYPPHLVNLLLCISSHIAFEVVLAQFSNVSKEFVPVARPGCGGVKAFVAEDSTLHVPLSDDQFGASEILDLPYIAGGAGSRNDQKPPVR